MAAWRVTLLRIDVFLVGFLLAGCLTAEAGSYWRSAHGNYASGVKRSDHTLYNRGNCGHCHEQHGYINGVSNGGPFPYALFTNPFSANAAPGSYQKADSVCFACHTTGTETDQEGGITNYDYAKTFGGYSASGKSDILSTFNQLSYHDLKDVATYAENNLSFFTSGSPPCVACHNPHLAKRIGSNPGNPAADTAISLPSAHDSLWGDDGNATDKETMYYFSPGHYQAPYAYGGTHKYEPGGGTTYDGSNLPNYAAFCTDCHNPNVTLYSTTLGRNLIKIDWTSQGGESGPGDKHGKNSATTHLSVKAPYAGAPIGISMGFALSCTDCHEPHGSPNLFLIRTEVNGMQVTVHSQTQGNEIGYLCRACHKDDLAYGTGATPNTWQHVHHCSDGESNDAPYAGMGGCGGCHSGGGGGGGGSGDRCTGSGRAPIPCLNCHMHGKDDGSLGGGSTGRICF